MFGGCQGQVNRASLGQPYQPMANYRSWTKVTEQPRRSAAHGRFITIYANPPAWQVKDRGGSFAPGALIVKETFADNNGTPGAADRIFAMEKRLPGFAPRSNDWYWVVTDTSGKVLAEGDEAALNGRRCAICHAGS
jgi:hypothetical protein